ncbi:MAG: HYR domain-containing protein [Saprospiraceae bacterium]|nr:HYR domain-containing protein [Saprospiraceae bacterium]
MNRKVSGFALLFISLLGACLSAQTTWTGVNSTNWNTASNWTNGLPGPFNEPTIPAAPSGPNSPVVSVFTYFNFNVHNYGTLTIAADGGVSLFGTFINYSSGTLMLANTATNMLIEASGILENYGNILNHGTFSNEGNFTNATIGSFGNNHVFSHSSGSFSNLGTYTNFGQFFSEASFQNAGTFNNHNLFNNNGAATNAGTMHSVAGSTLRNDQFFTNLPNGAMNISGTLLNNRTLTNQGQFTSNLGSEITNSQFVKNAATANWSNQGLIANVLCAIFENKGTLTNTSIFENEGFVYADSPISPNLPANMGSAVVIEPGNTGSLCHNATVGLAANNTATVDGLDLANNQLDFCTGWTLLVNGLPSYSFNGCASVGPHIVNVSFIDPSGRTTICTAIVTVVDDLAPILSCQSTLTIQLGAGQCTAPANLALPTVLVENCAVTSITNNALAMLPIGQTQVIWTATDQDGNAGFCSQTVIVVDQLPPTINCPPAKTLNTAPNQCGVLSQSPQIAGDPAFAFDNCGTPTVSNNAPTMLPLGNSTIIWTATDAFGNTSTCPQQITVIDATPPLIINCPPDITVQSQNTGCQAVATWGAAIATDNCSVPTQVFSISSGSVFNMGATPVTVLVSDASLNVATCQFIVTVADNQPPSWSNCPDNSIITLLDCGDVAVGNWTPPTANDPCLAGVASNFQPGDVLPFGQNLIEYVATDQAGNTSQLAVSPSPWMPCLPWIAPPTSW